MNLNKRIILLCSVFIFTPAADGRCPAGVVSSMPFVLEYVVWRGWHQALLYTPELEFECKWLLVRLIKCLSVNGVSAAIATDSGEVRLRDRLGIVVIAPRLRANTTSTDSLAKLLEKLSDKGMNTAPYDWLVVARSEQHFQIINSIFNVTSIRFDQNIVAAFPMKTQTMSLGVCDTNFIYSSNKQKSNRNRNYNDCNHRSDPMCTNNEHERNYYRSTERFRNLTRHNSYKSSGKVYPLYRSGILSYNYSRTFEMTNITDFSMRGGFSSLWHSSGRNIDKNLGGVHLVEYFKVRVNSTLYGYYLGYWNRRYSMSKVLSPYPVEARNFLGESLVVGRRNSTDGSQMNDEDGPSSPALLDDTLNFLTVRLNAKQSTRYYTKLGFRTYEGAWTGLLGALVDNSIDLALEPVTAQTYNDMDFIFPIAETMCNIYIRHQETSTVRDIFLAPFSPSLLACVFAVVVAAALAVAMVSRLAPELATQRPIEYAEAFLWSTGILCQQGANRTPRSPAASTLLIVSLLFAVVTYNSYAAFITSVLSVRVASVDTAAAVLYSTNFKIGYIRNGADQMYLMSTKDAVLNTFYIRGYSDAENLVSSAEEGLARAARYDYAFFAGQRAARSTLSSLSQARGRCALRELPVPSTKAQLAFPLPRHSPYARPTLVRFRFITKLGEARVKIMRSRLEIFTTDICCILMNTAMKLLFTRISLLQLRSGGALARLGAALVPSMPRCDLPAGFASARATDVRSALILLALGLVSASLLGIAEYFWKKRVKVTKFVVRLFDRVIKHYI